MTTEILLYQTRKGMWVARWNGSDGWLYSDEWPTRWAALSDAVNEIELGDETGVEFYGQLEKQLRERASSRTDEIIKLMERDRKETWRAKK